MPAQFFSPHFIREMAIILLTIAAAICVNYLLRSFIQVPRKLATRTSNTYLGVIRNIITLVILYITLHIIFLVLGISITPLLESAGVIGIVVGIGAQSVVKDVIAGFFLISQSTVAVGDYINVGGTIEGTVISIGLKNLTLLGPNGAQIIVPNGNVMNIINYSYRKSYVTIDIPVKAQLPIDDLLALFNGILKGLEKDEQFTILKESKVMGVKKIDGTGIVISTQIVTPYPFRASIEPDFYYHVIKEFEKRKLPLV